jgi:uncharacterized membrane protein YfcA
MNMKFFRKVKSKIYLVLSGIIIGIVNGFFGGGGGMVCVPILEKVLKIDNKKSHATALAVMLPIGISSALVYIFRVSMDWTMFSFVVVGFIIGGIIGASLLKKIKGKIVRVIFIFVVLAAGIRILL